MATLADKIRSLRGDRTYAEFADLTAISKQKLNDLENGESGKISTLRKIADACKMSDGDWAEVLIAWIEEALGDEARFLVISPASSARGDAFNAAFLFFQLFSRLSCQEQIQLLKASVRKEVRACLPPINAACDAVLIPGEAPDSESEVFRMVCGLAEALVENPKCTYFDDVINLLKVPHHPSGKATKSSETESLFTCPTWEKEKLAKKNAGGTSKSAKRRGV